jgi:hypothetical protein
VHSFPVVPGVPVQFLGAGGFRITCPISDGTGGNASTTGTLFFSHRSLDKWLTGTGGEVDPEFDHDHALGDAIFIPGLMPFGAPWQSCPTDKMSKEVTPERGVHWLQRNRLGGSAATTRSSGDIHSKTH